MEKEKIKNIQRKIKLNISSLVVYGGFITSLITSISAGHTLKLKRNLETDYQIAKIEYYKEIEEKNKKNEEQAKEQYKKDMIEYEKQLKEAAHINEVSIPKEYKNIITKKLKQESDYKKYGIITKLDLMTIKELEIKTNLDSSIDFMKYCTNLENLTILCPKECMNQLSKLTIMPNLKKFSLYTNMKTFNIQTAQSLYEKMPNLEELSIPIEILYEPNAIESMTQLKKLEINPYLNCDIDFKNLTHLDELKISSTEPYDIAIWFNSDEYNYLKENDVKITFEPGIEKQYLEISNKIDNILNSLPINENSSDDEILDAILNYVVKNYEYDEKINEYTWNELLEKKPSKEYYQNGYLYAILEKEKQICGNYASFVEAMYDRLKKPEDSFTLISDNHAWNQIKINGKEYYVDSTWLDTGLIFLDGEKITAEQASEMGILDQIMWYKEDPKSKFLKIIDGGAHEPINLPNYKEIGYISKEFNPTIKEAKPFIIKTVEKPKLNIELEKPNADFLDKEKLEKEKNYNKKINTNIEIGIAGLVVALATRIKKKRKQNELEEVEYKTNRF